MRLPMDLTEVRAGTGIARLDEILGGGLPSACLYVVQGEPGTGKTTLALQFLLEGVRQGEKVLYVTFSETRRELAQVGHSHGWDLSNLHLIDLSILDAQLAPESQNTLFHPSEIELSKMTDLILGEIEKINPSRIVFDSISEMRLLSEGALRYRRQVLAFKQMLGKRNVTVLFLDDLTGNSQDIQIQSIAHGVISLHRLHHEYGGERRRLRILKLRGVDFTSGFHDYTIAKGGIRVFPRLISADHEIVRRKGRLTSAVTQLDELLGGGLDWGTSNLFVGPAGTGKSTLAMQYAVSAARNGEKVAYFAFEETIENLTARSSALGLDLETLVSSGNLRIQQIDPAELSPGQFSMVIRDLVEKEGLKVMVIDSLNGYIQAMPQEQYLTLLVHELLVYLNNHGVITITVLAQQGLVGAMQSQLDLTYLADTVLLTRFFEARGAVKKAVSVIKKRTGRHEATIRELLINPNGVQVGPVLEQFQGVLTGVPRFLGSEREIFSQENDG